MKPALPKEKTLGLPMVRPTRSAKLSSAATPLRAMAAAAKARTKSALPLIMMMLTKSVVDETKAGGQEEQEEEQEVNWRVVERPCPSGDDKTIPPGVLT